MMNYIISTIKGVLALAIFVIATRAASTDFENIVIACLGLIYASFAIGIISIDHRVQKATLGLMHFLLLSMDITAKPEHKIEIEKSKKELDKGAELIDQSTISYGIELIFHTLIILGSLYLLYVSAHV